MTDLTFTDNLSGAVDFDGTVKFQASGMTKGNYFYLLEQGPDDSYTPVRDYEGNVIVARHPTASMLLSLKGSYRCQRSATFTVGYEA